MADSSQTQLYFVEETTWGTTPAAALKELRFTGESLGFNIETVTSNEIRADRQVSDLIQTNASASGAVNFELSYGAYDELIAAALFGDWTAIGWPMAPPANPSPWRSISPMSASICRSPAWSSAA